jgi:hypothetical protein
MDYPFPWTMTAVDHILDTPGLSGKYPASKRPLSSGDPSMSPEQAEGKAE